MHGALLCLAARAEALEQGFAQQRMQPIPGFPVGPVDGRDEQVVVVEAGEQGDHFGGALRLLVQRHAKRCAEALACRSAHQQLRLGGRQARQHFAFEIAGEGAGILHIGAHEAVGAGLRAAVLPVPLPVRGEQLQPGYPAIGQFVQLARVARADIAELRLQELPGFRQREAQVALVQFQHQPLVPQAAER
ncbi:hypothetical protein ACU4GI_34405 [Cupriavidus basilensis]